MISNRYTITADATQEIELLLTRFERDRGAGPVDLADYAPPGDDPAYNAVVTELARIDLEHRFNEGTSPEGTSYVESFPNVFQDPHLRAQLAFEEYRLRRRAGEEVVGIEIAGKYDVDGSHWPKLKLGDDSSDAHPPSRCFSQSELAVAAVRYPRVGDTLAGYPLVSRIGEGAFSRVFLARQPDLAGRLVVLKVTPLLTEESDRLATLQHSAIIPVYSVHREADLSCICMPFLGTTTLADLSACGERWASLEGPADELVSTIADRRRSTIGTVAEAASQQVAAETDETPDGPKGAAELAVDAPGVLATETVTRVGLAPFSQLGYVDALLELTIRAVEGLAHAHRRGIIHRDLKPANILVADDGSPLLLDFNLAVSSQEAKTRIVGGTLPYMSPQQLEALETGAAADMRDDVFSMGVILYELLSGRLPFDCPKSGEAFELASVVADRQKMPMSLRSLNSGVSPGLESIVRRCFAAQREQRYRDATDLLEDLNRHRRNLPLKFAPDRSAVERFSKWSARHPRLSSASSVATIAAAVLITCWLLIWQRGERIARMQVEANWQQLQIDLPNTIVALSTPGREVELLSNGLEQSVGLINQWHIGSDEWKSLADVDRLDAQSQRTLDTQFASLTYLMAAAEADIALQSDAPNKATLGDKALRWNGLAGKLLPVLQPLTESQRRRINSKLNGGSASRAQPSPNPAVQSLDLQAMWAAESGDFSLLRELTTKQLDSQPTNVTLWFNLAVSHWRLGELDQAAANFDICSHLQPRSVVTLFNRGLCNLERGELQAARHDFSACLQIKPKMATARFNRAVAAFRWGDFKAALDDLNGLVRTGRATTRMMLMRARVHDAVGDGEAAAADRRAALEMPPGDANDWVARGVAQLSQAPQAALADFNAALRVRPDHAAAINNAAHVYAERLGDSKQAIELLTRLVALRPDAASPVSSRGILRARLGDTEAALWDAQTAAQLSPGGLEQLQIAGIHALVNAQLDDKVNRKEAIVWLARALQSDSSLAKTASMDADLASLRDDARFRRLVGSAMAIESAAR